MITECPECGCEFDTDDKGRHTIDYAIILEPYAREIVTKLNKNFRHDCHVNCFTKFFSDQILVRIDCHTATHIVEIPSHFAQDGGHYSNIENIIANAFNIMHEDFVNDSSTKAS
jgi:hypothetical protein